MALQEGVMKRIARVVLLASIAAAALHAQTTRPDFSGTWIMDMTRSASAVQNDPIPQTTLVINQTATQLSIETQRAGKTSTITYRPGSADAITNATNRSNLLNSMWYWEGPKLITETVRDVNGQTVRTKEVRALEAAGTEMSVDTLLVVEHGYSQRGAQNYGSGKDIYKKQTDVKR
jgi:hypothetical protein